MHSPDKYLGYREADYQQPWARYYHKDVAPAPVHVQEALAAGPLPAGSLPPLNAVTGLQYSGYLPVETGFTLEQDGSARIAVLTDMPRVSPAMWQWWFGWHGCRDDRYKLWHPGAHCSARWQGDNSDRVAYIGRTSMIEEHIGQPLEKASIRFIDPAELGLAPHSPDMTFICARIGYTHVPLDFGWLVHQIRSVPGGAEMRSRFWIGGPHISVRTHPVLSKILSAPLRKIRKVPLHQAADLLNHCGEEMNHLARFLPELYQEFGK